MTPAPLLSIAAGVCPETGPVDLVAAAAAAGWDACGVWFDPDTWTDRMATAVRQRLDDTGLVALDLEPVFVVPDDHGGVADPGDRAIDAAAAVGARNVLVVNRGASPDAFAERFGTLCDRAAGADINCVVEFMAFMSTRRLDEALEVLDTVDRPNAGVLVDNLHLARSGSVPADLAAVDPSRLPYAQLCDAPEHPPDAVSTDRDDQMALIVEALDDRCAPGEGALPVAEFVGALPPGTPLSLEVRSKRLRDAFPDPADRARDLLAATRRFFDHPSDQESR